MSQISKFNLYCVQSKELIDPSKFCIDGYGDVFIISAFGRLLRADRKRFKLTQNTEPLTTQELK